MPCTKGQAWAISEAVKKYVRLTPAPPSTPPPRRLLAAIPKRGSKRKYATARRRRQRLAAAKRRTINPSKAPDLKAEEKRKLQPRPPDYPPPENLRVPMLSQAPMPTTAPDVELVEL